MNESKVDYLHQKEEIVLSNSLNRIARRFTTEQLNISDDRYRYIYLKGLKKLGITKEEFKSLPKETVAFLINQNIKARERYKKRKEKLKIYFCQNLIWLVQQSESS